MTEGDKGGILCRVRHRELILKMTNLSPDDRDHNICGSSRALSVALSYAVSVASEAI
jgi:hypothetical protein